jgi:uncharacterized lipoprotein YajG
VSYAKWIVIMSVGLIAVPFSGCAVKPQNIRLDPPVQVSPANLGQGKVVWLRVSDNRPRKTLGVIGDLEGQSAHVSIEDDPSTALYQNIAAGLRDLGFAVQPTPGPDGRALHVEVRDISYQSLKKTVTFDTEVKVALAAKAEHETERYDRLYEAGKTQTGPLLPSPDENARIVNRAVAMALEDMLNDPQLVGTLRN